MSAGQGQGAASYPIGAQRWLGLRKRRLPLSRIAVVLLCVAVVVWTAPRLLRLAAAPKSTAQELWTNSSSPYIEDKYTIMISTYARDEALKLTLQEIATGDLENLHSVIIVWHNPERDPPQDIVNSLPHFAVPVILRRSVTDSLNNRFLLGDDIKTRAVMSRDDDLCFGPGDVEFQFRQWQIYGRDKRMVGTAPREVIPNIKGDSRFMYRMKDLAKYEIILTNACFLDVSFMELYWAENAAAAAVRAYVDDHMNCEDIAMNFFAANATGLPPLLVEGREPRRYYRSSGISSSPSHFQTRGKCYDDFQDLFGGLQLPFSTEVIKRSGSEIRDFWDSIPPPPSENRPDTPSANELKHMNLIAADIYQTGLTQRLKDDLARKQVKEAEKAAEVLRKLRAEIADLKAELRRVGA